MNHLLLYTGIFVIQSATLMLEILLTRIFSVIAWYHLAFFVISLVMLGMTAGAVMVFVSPKLFSEEQVQKRLAQATLVFSILIPLAFGFALAYPLLPVNNLMTFLSLLWSGAILSLPFIMSGITITLALTRSGLPPSIVYGIDLCGAATGCLLVIPLLDSVDAPSAAILCAAVSALASLLFAIVAGIGRFWPIFFIFLFIAIGIGNASVHPSPFRPSWVKGKKELTNNLSYIGWNTYSRVTMEKTQNRLPVLWSPSHKIPMRIVKPIPQREMLIDGAARTVMAKLGNSIENHSYIGWDLTSFVHFLRPKGPTAIIGIGGGRDVLEAVRRGHKPVVGIEINELIVDLHKRIIPEYSGISALPDVEIVADEARSFLSRDSKKYDVIMMSLIDTWASTGAGAYSLSENGLYTVEAWMTFISRLTTNGIFTVSRWYNPASPGETVRMTALAMESLWRSGAQNPAYNLIVLQNDHIATLLLSPSPFSPADLYRTQKEVGRLNFRVLILPFQQSPEPALAKVIQQKSSQDLWNWTSSQTLDLTPPTDNRPFFFNMLKPTRWFASNQSILQLDMTFLGNLQATQTLIYSILVSLILTLVTIIAPLYARRKDLRSLPPLDVFAACSYFALIGLGFMYVEMGLLSKLNVLIGHPTLALAVLLGGIILFMGFGSLLSSYVSLERRIVACLYPLVPAILVFISSFVTPQLQDAMGSTTFIRVAISLAVIAPSALGLGICFPLGLRLVERIEKKSSDSEKPASIGPWLWGINGAFGVCASGLALGTSMVWGIHITIIIGAFCYLILPLVTWRLTGH